jgi:hypothetical protein
MGSPNFTYTFHGDPRATFAQFFGTSNPFENFFNMPGMGGTTHQVSRTPCIIYTFTRTLKIVADNLL